MNIWECVKCLNVLTCLYFHQFCCKQCIIQQVFTKEETTCKKQQGRGGQKAGRPGSSLTPDTLVR